MRFRTHSTHYRLFLEFRVDLPLAILFNSALKSKRRKVLTRISFSLFSIRSKVVLSSCISRRPAARNAASITVESSRSWGLPVRSRMVRRSSAIKAFLGLRSLMYQSHERNFSMKLAALLARSGKPSLVRIVVLPVEISLVSQNGSSNRRAKLRNTATSGRYFRRETRR